ncbi:electron transport complex subunit RsxB [Roseateles oligotrophus]|uniref:Electron transport complex subunit RsxB n=1 Tax=Roseateles oligotrophus TaxID=1769250 RepID=A0ABT2YFY1_9BURK|nr:electron transport complex subunit RsxB [Roseateles oligotrophus]MCV2368966.1 electron transport complex subunit RsxB [Roseateles oligotrophus]
MTTQAKSAALQQFIAAIDAALPQTQCTRCGYPDCHAYAVAVAAEQAQINQCPPGGAEGIRRLAAITGRSALPLSAEHGAEGPLKLAVIDEAWCIGCTLCIKACPVDCIVGAPKQMHVVVAEQCTGCELCVPACPVDCISLVALKPELSGWAAWGAPQADAARERYRFHQLNQTRAEQENSARLVAKAEAKLVDLAAVSKLTEPTALDAKRAVIEAALARARAKRQG